MRDDNDHILCGVCVGDARACRKINYNIVIMASTSARVSPS